MSGPPVAADDPPDSSGPSSEGTSGSPHATSNRPPSIMGAFDNDIPRSGVVYLVPVATAEQRAAGWLGCLIGLDS